VNRDGSGHLEISRFNVKDKEKGFGR
jgi:hypothetical protein